MTTNTPYQAGSERRGRSAQPPQGGAREPRGEDGLPQSHLLRPAPGGDWRGVPSASTAVRTRQPLGLSEHLPPTPRVPSKALRGSCPLGPWRACFLQEAESRTCWSSVLGPEGQNPQGPCRSPESQSWGTLWGSLYQGRNRPVSGRRSGPLRCRLLLAHHHCLLPGVP